MVVGFRSKVTGSSSVVSGGRGEASNDCRG